jgi:acetyltransferase-like isoleucine patch superfamily enzyme
MALTLTNRISRSLHKRWQGLHARLTKARFRSWGQIELADSTTVMGGARIELTSKSDRDWVVRIGPKSRIKSGAILAPREGFIDIGSGCSVNPFCVFMGYGGITLGNNVRIATGCTIVAFTHEFGDPDTPIIEQGNSWKGVTLEDDVWLGAGVRVLDGVTIGRGSVVGAGSVVNKSIPPNSIAVGVPAKVVKTRS